MLLTSGAGRGTLNEQLNIRKRCESRLQYNRGNTGENPELFPQPWSWRRRGAIAHFAWEGAPEDEAKPGDLTFFSCGYLGIRRSCPGSWERTRTFRCRSFLRRRLWAVFALWRNRFFL